jgi:hypothetical protein
MLVKDGDIPSVDCRGDSLSLALFPPDVDGSGNGRRLTRNKSTVRMGRRGNVKKRARGGYR